jgi:hypothetical protein
MRSSRIDVKLLDADALPDRRRQRIVHRCRARCLGRWRHRGRKRVPRRSSAGLSLATPAAPAARLEACPASVRRGNVRLPEDLEADSDRPGNGFGCADRLRPWHPRLPQRNSPPGALANWPSFRIQHLLEEESSKDVRLIASAHGLRFRSGRGSSVSDSYRTSRTRYREIACLVAVARSSSVLVGAAPWKTWAHQAETIERTIASLRTD